MLHANVSIFVLFSEHFFFFYSCDYSVCLCLFASVCVGVCVNLFSLFFLPPSFFTFFLFTYSLLLFCLPSFLSFFLPLILSSFLLSFFPPFSCPFLSLHLRQAEMKIPHTSARERNKLCGLKTNVLINMLDSLSLYLGLSLRLSVGSLSDFLSDFILDILSVSLSDTLSALSDSLSDTLRGDASRV